MREQLEQIGVQATEALKDVMDMEKLNDIRLEYLGKKGKLTGVLRGMGKLSSEERPVIGQLANEIRDQLEQLLTEKTEQLSAEKINQQLAAEKIDITLPGKKDLLGQEHPLNLVLREMEHIFVGMGFEVIEGPEIELDYYNFEALNIPADHPARDTQDTFYVTDNILLRTQTSPVQIRTMEKQKPPIRMISPGRVFRSDQPDATHSPMFHQVEGLLIDKTVSFSDLKGILIAFVEQMFGKGRGVRFRPHHFPFTEPSAEVDIACLKCGGEGCRICSGTGWLEILGAGMVHPRVLEMANIDPKEYSGFAFGMGVERIAMLKYGIDDIRLFFENDVRFLSQF